MTIPRLWPWKKEQEQLLPGADELLQATRLPTAEELLAATDIPMAAPIMARPPSITAPEPIAVQPPTITTPEPVPLPPAPPLEVPSTSRWPTTGAGEPERRREMFHEAFGVAPSERIPIEEAGPVRRGLETGIEFGKEAGGEEMRMLGAFLRKGPQASPQQLEQREEAAAPHYPTIGAIPTGRQRAPVTSESSRRRASLAQVAGTQPEAPTAVSQYLETRGPEIAEEARARAEKIPRPKRLNEIKSVGDALEWAAFGVAQGVASSVPSLVGGAVGGAVGGFPGAFFGASLPGYILNQNEVRRSLMEEGVSAEEADRISAFAAIPMAALDALLPGRIGAQLTGPLRQRAQKAIAKQVLAAMVSGGKVEAVTETVQTIIEQGTTAAVTGRPLDVVEMIEAGLIGGATGALLSGAGQAVTEGRISYAEPAPPPLAERIETLEEFGQALEEFGPSRPTPVERPRDEALAPPGRPEEAVRPPEQPLEPRMGGVAPVEPLPPVVSPTERAGGVPLEAAPVAPEAPVAPAPAESPLEIYRQSLNTMNNEQIQGQVNQVQERLEEAAREQAGIPGLKEPQKYEGAERRDLEMNKQRWEALEPQFIRRRMGEWPEIAEPEPRPEPGEVPVEPAPEGESVGRAAIRAPDGKIYEGTIHPEARDEAIIARIGEAEFRQLGDEAVDGWYDRLIDEGYESGWTSSTGRWMSEKEAQELAIKRGQATQESIDKNERLESLSIADEGTFPEAAKGAGRTPAIHDIDHEELFTGRTFREALEQMDWNNEEALGEVQLDFEAGKIGDTLDWGWVDEAGNFKAGEGKMPAEFLTDVNDPKHGPPVPPEQRIAPEDLKVFVPEEYERGLWVIRDNRPGKEDLATYLSPEDFKSRLAVFASQSEAEKYAGQWEWMDRLVNQVEEELDLGEGKAKPLEVLPEGVLKFPEPAPSGHFEGITPEYLDRIRESLGRTPLAAKEDPLGYYSERIEQIKDDTGLTSWFLRIEKANAEGSVPTLVANELAERLTARSKNLNPKSTKTYSFKPSTKPARLVAPVPVEFPGPGEVVEGEKRPSKMREHLEELKREGGFAKAVEPAAPVAEAASWRTKVDSVIGTLSRTIQEYGKAKPQKRTEAEFWRDELVKALGENNEARAKSVMMSVRDAGLKIDAEAAPAAEPEVKAIERFGATNDPKVAGFLLVDGTMLDFSDTPYSKTGTQRAVDHQAIAGIMGSDPEPASASQSAIARFVNRGNARVGFSETSTFVHYSGTLTEKQTIIIRKWVAGQIKANGSHLVMMDVVDDKGIPLGAGTREMFRVFELTEMIGEIEAQAKSGVPLVEERPGAPVGGVTTVERAEAVIAAAEVAAPKPKKAAKQKRLVRPKWYKINMSEESLEARSDEDLDKLAEWLNKNKERIATSYEEGQVILRDLQRVFDMKAKRRGDLTIKEEAESLRGVESKLFLEEGQQLRTESGRIITVPRFKGKLQQRLNQVDDWLVREAIEEAESKNEDFGMTQFQQMAGRKLSPADRDALNEYVFGGEAATTRHLIKPAEVAPVKKPAKKKAAKKEPNNIYIPSNKRKLRHLKTIRETRKAKGDMEVVREAIVDDYTREYIDAKQYHRLVQELEGRPVLEIPIEDEETGKIKKVPATNLDSEELADHWVKVFKRADETAIIAGDQWMRFDENIQATRASHTPSAGKAQKRIELDAGVLAKIEAELFSRGYKLQDLIDRVQPPPEGMEEGGVPADEAAAQAEVFGGETFVGKEQTELLGADVGKRTAKLGEEKIGAEEMAERAEEVEPEGERPLEMELEKGQKAITKIEEAETGKPFAGKMFHGSGRADPSEVYNPLGAQIPILGPGRYSTPVEEAARAYGPDVEEVDVRIKNPLVIRTDDHWRTLTQEAGWEYPNLFGLDPKVIETRIGELRKLVEDRGYDGVIINPSTTGDQAKTLWKNFGDPQAIEFREAPAVEAKPKKKRIVRPKWYKLGLSEETIKGLSDEQLEKGIRWLNKKSSSDLGLSWDESQLKGADLQHLFNERAERQLPPVEPEGDIEDVGEGDEIVGSPASSPQDEILEEWRDARDLTDDEARRRWPEEMDQGFDMVANEEMRVVEAAIEAGLIKEDLANETGRHEGWERMRVQLDNLLEAMEKERTGTEGFDKIVGSPPIDVVSPEGRREAAGGTENIGYGLEGNLEKPSDWKPGDTITEPTVMHLLSDILVAAGGAGTMRVGRLTLKGAAAEFKVEPEVIRVRRANDIPRGSHEVGHAIEKLVFGWEKGGAWKKPRASAKMQKELAALGKALYGNKKPNGGYKREGWAEFWKKWLKEEKGLEQSAPELYRWFHEEFLTLNPEIAAAAQKAKEGVKAWREQGSVERGRTKLVDPASIPERLRRANEKIHRAFSMEKLVEMAQPLFDLSKEVNAKLKAEGKGPLTFSQDPYLITAALRTVQAARTKGMIEDGMINLAGQLVGPSMRDVTNLIKGKQADFGLYLYAKRSLAMWDDPQGFRDPGISRIDAVQAIKELGSDEFETAAVKLYAWLDGVLDYMAEASPTFAQVVARTRKRDPGSYIPLARYFEEIDDMWAKSVGRTASQRSPVKHLKGSGRRIKEPIQQIIAQTEQMIRSAHARMVIDAIIKVSRVEGMGHIIEEVPKDDMPAARVSLNQVIKEANKKLKELDLPNLELEGEELKLSDLAKEDLEQTLTFFAPASFPKGVDPVVPIYAEGKVKWYHVDGKLYDTLSSLDVYRLPDVAGLPLLEMGLGKPAAAFRAGTTGLRASFGLITNPLRDFQTLYVNSRASANGAKLFWYWMHSMGSAMLDRATAGQIHPSEWMDAFIQMGGEMAQPLGQDIPHTRLAARKLFQGRVVKTLDPRNWFEFYRELIQFPEMAARVAEFRAVAKDIGWEPGMPMTLDQSLQLLLAGKQVTTDFTAAGELARLVNRMAPFFNAAIQGPRANIRAAKANKMKFAWRGAQLAMATIGLWWMYKDEDWYKELKAKEKFMYWHFPVDFPEPTLVRIPRAFEVGLVFSALPEAFLDSWYQEDPEGVKEWMKVFLQTSIPSPMPVIPRIAAEQLANKVFYFDRPIVPTREDQKDPEEQYNEYTTKAAIRLAKIFSVGPVELSPMRIDHAITGMFGYVARDVLQLLGLGGPELSREKEAADMPLFGRLFQRGGEIGTRPKSIEKVYDQLEDLQRIQYSTIQLESEEQRQRRLMLTDAARSISALLYVRRYTDKSDQREALTRTALDQARDVLKVMKSGETVRNRFQAYRRQAEIQKEIKEAEMEGRSPELGRPQRPSRPRRPSR